MTHQEAKESIDYRDICYFIKHVRNLDLRISVINSLGYNIGVNVAKEGDEEGSFFIGMKGEARVQLEPRNKKFPLVRCAIIERTLI